MRDPRRAGLIWESVDGDALRAAYDGQASVAAILPTMSAIYIWRLRLRPDVDPNDRAGLLSHVKRIASLPQGRVEDLPMSRGLTLAGMVFGGSGLPDNKLAVLERMLGTRQGARFLWDYLGDLESRVPALYVGESGNLPQRITDHLAARTQFGAAVEREPELTWQDLRLEYVRTGDAKDSESEYRRALEYLTTVLTVANYTQRAG